MKNIKHSICRAGCPHFALSLLFFLSSCSWIATDRSSVNQTEGSGEQTTELPGEADIPEMVEREKYIELLRENQELKARLNPSMAAEAPATIPMNTESEHTQVQPLELKNDLSAPAEAAILDDGTIATAVQRLQQAIRWQESGRGGEALKVFQELEHSPSKQVQVHAKFQAGLLFYSQKEYDLALQTFEAVINQFAFSGLVIKAVEFSMLSAEKLGLIEKKEQYLSILRDVFKATT